MDGVKHCFVMRKVLLLFVSLSFMITVYAQQGKVSKAKIYLEEHTLVKLDRLGIPIDHVEYKKDHYIISEFSAYELDQMRNNGFKVDILVDDMVAEYLEKNRVLKNGFEFKAGCNVEPLIEVEHFEYGSMGGFLTYEEILENLDAMHEEYPDLISERSPISTFRTHEDRPIYWSRISNNPNVDQDKKEIFYNAVHHAREAITVSQTIFFMWYLLENYEDNPQVKDIIDNLELYFVPCVNPDGYIYNQTTNPNGGGFWRKNRRVNANSFGVDLNRNYGYQWGGNGSSGNENSDTYRGPYAFSEPELQAIKWLVEQHEFEIALNYHSYSNLLLHPWGYTYDACPDDALFRDMKNYLTAENGYANISGAELYITSGAADDWMYGDVSTSNKILAMTPEVGGVSDGFWPTLDRILPLCSENIHPNLGVALVLLDYVEVSDLNSLIIPRAGQFKFGLKRLGLDATPYQVSVEFLETNGTDVPKNIAALEYGEIVQDVFNYDFTGENFDEVTFKITVNTGNYSYDFMFTKTIAEITTVFEENENSLSSWTTASWDKTSSEYYSAPFSTTDSPNGNYSNSSNTSITVDQIIDLSNVTKAFAEFWAKWEIEDGYDYAQIQASIEGSNNWTPLCGKYTTLGNNNQDEGQPLYDNIQGDWVLEVVDLNDFVGEKIRIRFVLITDPGVTMDGFYFDEFKVKVRKIDTELPVANCISNLEVFLEDNGSATIEAEDIDNNSTDNEVIATLELNVNQFGCNNIGQSTVELTVTDASANEATCNAIVSVLDTIKPLVVCQDFVIDVSEQVTVTVQENDLTEVVQDNCAIESIQLSQSDFTIGDIGSNEVVVTVEDVNGNISSCIANVEVNLLTKVFENESSIQFDIRPNPFSDQVEVSINGHAHGPYDAIITNINGSVMRKYINNTTSSLTIKKGRLNKGIYFISIYQKEQKLGSAKLVIE